MLVQAINADTGYRESEHKSKSNQTHNATGNRTPNKSSDGLWTVYRGGPRSGPSSLPSGLLVVSGAGRTKPSHSHSLANFCRKRLFANNFRIEDDMFATSFAKPFAIATLNSQPSLWGWWPKFAFAAVSLRLRCTQVGRLSISYIRGPVLCSCCSLVSTSLSLIFFRWSSACCLLRRHFQVWRLI